MAKRDIVHVPDPVLRRKAREIKEFGVQLNPLIADMVETMRDAPGVGLAGPQINVPLRIIVVEYPENDQDEDAPAKLFVVLNPEITRHAEETVSGIEGCLSIPGLVGEVDRYTGVTVRGQNRFGRPIKIKANGWLARIFQHEIDHLDGVLFTDKAVRVWRPEAEEADAVPLD